MLPQRANCRTQAMLNPSAERIAKQKHTTKEWRRIVGLQYRVTVLEQQHERQNDNSQHRKKGGGKGKS